MSSANSTCSSDSSSNVSLALSTDSSSSKDSSASVIHHPEASTLRDPETAFSTHTTIADTEQSAPASSSDINGHNTPDSPHPSEESAVTGNPLKRKLGRSSRSQTVTTGSSEAGTVGPSNRPRRTPRAVNISPTATSVHTSRAEDVCTKQASHTTLPSPITAPDPTPVPEPNNPARAVGQRTSTRSVRPPGKFTEATAVPTHGRSMTITPSNQRLMVGQLQQQQEPELIRKRGPGRPPRNPQTVQSYRPPDTPAATLPSPPPVVLTKRGPGRPPRNLVVAKTTPHGVTPTSASSQRAKAKSTSPVMARSSNNVINGARTTSTLSPSRSAASTNSEPAPIVKRGPGRPPKNLMTNHLPNSTSTASSSKHPGQTQVASPNATSPRSRKRHNKSETEEEEESSVVDGKDPDSGRTPRKRRALSVTQGSSPKQGQASTKNKTSVPEPPKVPKPLTPLDKARIAKITEWERKLQEVVDHHDSLARELYHLETYTTTLTYDPVKIKSDHSERMLRFLRNFDLWSQVPELVSNVHLSTGRISTRRSANEHREQLVDMLQKNVVEALPGRADMAASSDLIRLGPHRGYHSQFNSFEDYLNSFVYADEEEVTPQEADKRAEVHAKLLDRIDTLKEAGRFGVRPIKPFVDPEVPKLQYNWLLEHIMTSSRLIKEEGKLQMARARKVSKMIARHFEQLHGKSEREQRLEEKRIRKLAKLTANEVKKKWRYVEGIVKARHKALLQEEQEEAGKRHLNLILEHSTQILEVQQSAFNLSVPGTPGTPGTPGRMSDVPGLSDVLSDMPSTPSGTDPISRRSSVAPSTYSSDAEIDTGDTEFTVENAEADDETTLARDESGTEDDEEEISGLEAEMDIPIEELLKQYGYQLSGDEGSDGDRDGDDEEEGDEMDVSFAEDKQPDSSHQDDIDLVSAQQSDVKMDMDVEMESTHMLLESSDTQEIDELPSLKSASERGGLEEKTVSSKDIAEALPEDLKAAGRLSTLERNHASKRRRLSLEDLYRGPPLPWNPYGEVDDERTMEEEEQDEQSDPEELADLLAERDMSIESLLDKYGYELESSEYSDSDYDSDSEGEGSVMSAQQRIRSADPRYVVTLQDVTHSRKFPTRPSSEFTDTDTEYDDNRTISIYGSDDELCLGDMLPLLDPEVPPKSPEVETFTTGANVKTKIPFLLRHQLREYQHVGMDWLAQLYSNGLNGILADEMGLGKTMQTIALLAHLACEHEVWGPHLIVVPTSVILNWEMEFKKWCPGFKIMTYYGSPRERKEKRIGWSRDNSFHVCITSYQLVVQDQAVFRRKAWQYLILDEAHNIKNFRSQRWQTLLNFNSARRLLLTGTPLQNNLMELWSLLYFLMPNGVSQTMPVGFANQKEFQEWFSHPVDRMIEGNDQQDEDSKAAIARLHTVLRPYLLRRLKADVETQMPAKYEHIVYCRLSKRQRFLYDDFMSRAKTRETLASGNFLSIINCLMQLRKVCNHPDLFEVRPIVTSFAMPSAIASFEITEFLIRRTIFSEIDQARESLNLEFLGFVFTNAEDRLSRMDLDTYDELDASSCFQKKAAEFATPQSKTLSNANHYQDIRQYASMRRHRQLQAHKQRWEQLGYVNKNRCHAQLVYGSCLLRMCRSPVLATEGCDNILDQAADPRRYLNYTDAIARAVVPSEARFHQNEETIKRFTFVTPAVLVQDYTWRPIHINPTPSTLEEVCQRATELFHPATSCLQIQFPDKRLLQFDCGKLQKLDSLLRELKSGGHRALIFTQMTKMLDILEIFLNIHGHRYLRLDGATKVENRQLLTDRFNSDPKILAFILSTRSGGVGINLTGADTVIFYDSDWNPSMDRQCQDRCHRIGQTRDVHIYRFVSEFTIEENMLKKANQKRMLDNVVIQEGGFTTDFFQKMDWRDMLGEEDLAKIGDLGSMNMDEEQEPSVVQGAELEQALAAAEDENDVLAMQQAKHEMEGVDVNDFSEAGTSASALAGSTVTKTGKDVSGKNAKKKWTETSGAKVQFAGTVSIEPAATEEDGEVIEMGHVDEYMLRFMEREYGHYVGFGGLPKPVKGEGSDGLMAASDTPELAEQENEDEDEGEEEEAEEAEEAVEAEEAEEEEEEEDEYEIEDTEESDNGADSNGSSSEADNEENESLEEDG